MEKIITGFVRLLTEKASALKWHGWERDSNYRGVFRAYRSYADGFVITITHHDYGAANRVTAGSYSQSGVFWRRGLNRNKHTKWFEISVTDESARFGRRMILDKEIFVPESPLYEKVTELWKLVEATGKLFKPGLTFISRLSKEQSLLGVCRSLKSL